MCDSQKGWIATLIGCVLGIGMGTAHSVGQGTPQFLERSLEDPMMRSGLPGTELSLWGVAPLITAGEEFPDGLDFNQVAFDYRWPGAVSGLAAYGADPNTVHVLVSHRLPAAAGYPYPLDPGTLLNGSRFSLLEVDRVRYSIRSGRQAAGFIVDRKGLIVSQAAQITEQGPGNGFESFGFAEIVSTPAPDASGVIVLTGEATSDGYEITELFPNVFASAFGITLTGFGGQACVLSPAARIIYTAPMLGRARFEGMAHVSLSPAQGGGNPFVAEKVALVICDGMPGSPLYLYVGQANREPAVANYVTPPFLKSNGLGYGRLFVWRAADAVRDPDGFNGTGAQRPGAFVSIAHYDPALAGVSGFLGWDAQGFASTARQQLLAEVQKAFRFGALADVAADPDDGTRFVLVSRGRGQLFAADTWGATYLLDIDDASLAAALGTPDVDQIGSIAASLEVLYDSDDAANGAFGEPDEGIRGQAAIEWAADGTVYAGESRSTVLRVPPGPFGCAAAPDPAACEAGAFGGISGLETAVWFYRASSGEVGRIVSTDRTAVPFRQTDLAVGEIGSWRPSAILDVAPLFPLPPTVRLLVIGVEPERFRSVPQVQFNPFTRKTIITSTTLAKGQDSDPDDDGVASEAELAEAQRKDLVQGGQLLFAFEQP